MLESVVVTFKMPVYYFMTLSRYIAVLLQFIYFCLLFQPLNESGYSTVEFGAPDMLVRCGTKGKVENHYCFFKLEKDDANLYGPHTVWRIPSGIKAHADLVSAATFIAALLSTLAIVVASLYYSNS